MAKHKTAAERDQERKIEAGIRMKAAIDEMQRRRHKHRYLSLSFSPLIARQSFTYYRGTAAGVMWREEEERRKEKEEQEKADAVLESETAAHYTDALPGDNVYRGFDPGHPVCAP
jgi:hypothetical protein